MWIRAALEGSSKISSSCSLSAAVAAYFYLRFALTLYADDDVEGTRITVPWLTGTTIAVGVIVAILFGIWPGPLATWVQHATLLFLP